VTGSRRIELDRPRSVGEILGAAASLYRAYPWLFLVLAASVMVPFELAVLAVTGDGPLHQPHEPFATSMSLTLLRTTLVGPLISALHIHAVALAGRGRRPRLGAVALRGLRALPVVVAADVVATVATFLGFLLLIVPGIVLLLMLSVTAQAAALEGTGWTGALRSSRNLTGGRYGHVFGVLLATGLIGTAAGLLAGALPLGSATGAASVAVGVTTDTLTASFAALTVALLYFDLAASSQRSEAAEREHPHLRDLD
jgi:hypothetical protein